MGDNTMQASTSRAGALLWSQTVRSSVHSASIALLPCTCRHSSTSTEASATVSEPQAVQSSPLPVAIQQLLQRRATSASAQRSAAPLYSTYDAARTKEPRNTVLLTNLSKTVIPDDIRRFARTLRSGGVGLKSVVMLPSSALRSKGRCFIEFDHPINAVRFRDAALGRSCPGSPHLQVECRLVDPSKRPFPAALSDRTPLTLRGDEAVTVVGEDGSGSVRLAGSLEWSGRAVLLSGFPKRLPPVWILKRLAKDDFSPVRAPGLAADGGALDTMVQISQSPDMRTESSWVSYLVRLPSQAEAHRLAREWHATSPTWGGMFGEWKIRVEVVW